MKINGINIYFLSRQNNEGDNVIKPKLTQEELKKHVHYDPETGIITRIQHRQKSRVGKKMGWLKKTKYGDILQVKILRRDYSAGAIAWLYVYGEYPEKVRHLNENQMDCRISNLYESNLQEICQDRRRPTKNNKSGLLGVSWFRKTKKWVAHIRAEGRTIGLGYYHDKHQAYAAYLDAKKRYHPESKLAQCL